MSSLTKRLERIEQRVKPVITDWRAYAAVHGLTEREIAEEVLRMIQKGECSHYDAEVIAEAKRIAESILGVSHEHSTAA